MKVLLSWLREFAPFADEPDALAYSLSMLGTTVEAMERIGEFDDGIVVARVVELRRHSKAERVQRVVVEVADGRTVEVWCGAFNMEVGDRVPLATVGAVMPDGMPIGRRRILGEYSDGMLCSPVELGLGADHSGILILPDHAALGARLAQALHIEPDVLYDLEVNPNRPDAMSVAGVARDLAGWYRLPFELPTPAVATAGEAASTSASVEILDADLCGRFTASVLRGITVGPSPSAIANRLTLLGVRPINNVVDASNYVMLELGQPNHPYDLATLPGGAIRVRRARPGETMVTLDDVERRFTADDLLIADGNDTAIGIAGIMGGAATEISEHTRDVLLEMAWFQPMAVARSSRRLGVRSEASARFEKGCDPWVIERAATRFAELLGGVGGDLAPGMVDARGDLAEPSRVGVRPARVRSIIGTDISAGQIVEYLTPIGFEVTEAADGDGDGPLEVVVPSFRPDTTTEIDVIEEVARHHGYQNIVPTLPPTAHTGALTETQRDRRAIRRAMVGLGYAEAMPLPFLAPGDQARAGLTAEPIVITNPLVAEESVLRTSLLPGLLKAVAFNESHRTSGAALFEIGHVIRHPDEPSELPDEREHAGVALAGREAPAAAEALVGVLDALRLPEHRLVATGDTPGTHPTRSARVVVDGHDIGVVGEVDPGVLAAFEVAERVAWVELDLDALLALPHGEPPYRLVSRYPSSDIDLAFEVPETVPAAEVERVVRDTAGALLVGLDLFDVYRGPGLADGARSLAFRLRFQAGDRTLTDADVAAARQRVIDAVHAALPATLRG
ncbi:MAG: phenylalanine--tRNA ligase subunit beta [Acidimicrobiales bacterium]